MTHEEYRMEEGIKGWNMLFTAVFAALAALGFLYLKDNRLLPQEIPILDFFILVFAVMRLIQLFVYDNITLFIRETALDVKRVRYAETGEEFVERVPSRSSLKRTLEKLFGCPWCMGVWLAALSVFIYFAFPDTWILFLILAVSGAASTLKVLVNLIGWAAERQKSAVQKESK